MWCNREKSEGHFWETTPNVLFPQVLKVSLLMRNFTEHVPVASSSPTSMKCHCFLLSCLFPGIFHSVTFYFLTFPEEHTPQEQKRGNIPEFCCSFAELRIATFLKVAFLFAKLKEYHAAKKIFLLTQLSILSNSWLYIQPTCTHSWLPIQFSCHKESSALKFSFLLELSHSQVEDGLLHLLSEIEGQEKHFNLLTN